MKKRALHWSHIASLMRCGVAFQYAYIEGLRVRPGVALGVGIAAHATAAANLLRKAQTGVLMPIEELRDTARDAFGRELEGGLELDDDTSAGQAADKTIRMAVGHHRYIAPELRPTVHGIERAWRVEVEGYPFDLEGTMDLDEPRQLVDFVVTAPSAIHDYKTSGVTPSPRLAATSGQLTMYVIGKHAIDDELPDRVALDYTIDRKADVKVGHYVSERRPEHIAAFWRRLERIAEIIEKQVFTPSQPYVDWWCSPKWCGYARTNPDTGHPYCEFFSEAHTFFAATSTGGHPIHEQRISPKARKRSIDGHERTALLKSIR